MLFPITRRQWLTSTGCGFGALALSALAQGAPKPGPLQANGELSSQVIDGSWSGGSESATP